MALQQTHMVSIDHNYFGDLETAKYIATLDKFVTDDSLIANPTYEDILLQLSQLGIVHIGNLVALSRAALIEQYSLTVGQVDMLQSMLRLMGLGLESNVTYWEQYRRDVPPLSRLVDTGNQPFENSVPFWLSR